MLPHLETIIQIAKLTPPKYKLLLSFLEETTHFSGISTIEQIEDPNADNFSWWMKTVRPLPRANQYGINDSMWLDVFGTALFVLEDLEKHYPTRLPVLAKLAICDSASAEILRYIIFETGFPKDPKSLRRYVFDSKNTSSPHNSELKRIRKYVKPDVSEQNDESDKSQKRSDFVKILIYYPECHIDPPSKRNDCPNGTCTSIFGSSPILTDYLLDLNYVPANTCVVAPEFIPQAMYRVNFTEGYVDSSTGRAELNEEQIARISEIMDSI